jgi:hypothetical protein
MGVASAAFACRKPSLRFPDFGPSNSCRNEPAGDRVDANDTVVNAATASRTSIRVVWLLTLVEKGKRLNTERMAAKGEGECMLIKTPGANAER